MGICAVACTMDRIEVVDFTYFIILDQMLVLSKGDVMKKPDLTLFIDNRISMQIWLCILITFLTILVLLYYFEKFSTGTGKLNLYNHHLHWKNNKTATTTTKNSSSLGLVAIKLCQIILKQCNNDNNINIFY